MDSLHQKFAESRVAAAGVLRHVGAGCRTVGPDILTLEGVPEELPADGTQSPGQAVAMAVAEPQVSFRMRTDADIYADRHIAVRHVSRHDVVAVIEIVSPGNKGGAAPLRKFTEKAAEFLMAGVNLLIADLFPPSPRDPEGIHPVVWEQFDRCDFVLPPGRDLTLVSYLGGSSKEAFIEPVAVGFPLPDMPLFLSRDLYVRVPLESTYLAAWEEIPAYWRGVFSGTPRPA
jgi:hypothetical protein